MHGRRRQRHGAGAPCLKSVSVRPGPPPDRRGQNGLARFRPPQTIRPFLPPSQGVLNSKFPVRLANGAAASGRRGRSSVDGSWWARRLTRLRDTESSSSILLAGRSQSPGSGRREGVVWYRAVMVIGRRMLVVPRRSDRSFASKRWASKTEATYQKASLASILVSDSILFHPPLSFLCVCVKALACFAGITIFLFFYALLPRLLPFSCNN